jgi:hypothetical protein
MLILFLTEYVVKVNSQVWAILLAIPWIGLVVVIVYAIVRDRGEEGNLAAPGPLTEPDPKEKKGDPVRKGGMSPDPLAVGEQAREEMGKAVRNLILAVFATDMTALIVLFGIEIFLGWWNRLTTWILFLVVSAGTTAYLRYKLRKITGG